MRNAYLETFRTALLSCSVTRLPFDGFDVYFHLVELTSAASHAMLEIPLYATRMLQIAIFQFIAKHKGRSVLMRL